MNNGEEIRALAREAMELLRTQPQGDLIRLRTIAVKLRGMKDPEADKLVELIEDTAWLFESEK